MQPAPASGEVSHKKIGLPLALLLSMAIGCGGYGKVSPAAYDYATALYSLANRQAAERIDEVAERIDTAVTAGELPEHEAAWLRDILADARNGEWKAAQQAARQIMEDQVER